MICLSWISEIVIRNLVMTMFLSISYDYVVIKIQLQLKKRLQHRCFAVKFAKFLRAPILKNICKRLLLTVHYFRKQLIQMYAFPTTFMVYMIHLSHDTSCAFLSRYFQTRRIKLGK